MRKYLQIVLSVVVMCLAISSCKLDPPILPDDPNYVAYTPPGSGNLDTDGSGSSESAIAGIVTGTTGSGADVKNSNLTGVWAAATTKTIVYNENNAIAMSVDADLNMFETVTFDDAAKTCELVPGIVADPRTYTLSTSNNKLYMQLPSDPFNRTANEKIQITNLSANAMTWLIPEPMTNELNGQTMHSAYLMTFTK